MIRWTALFIFVVYLFSGNVHAQSGCVLASGAPLKLGGIFPPPTLFNAGLGDAERGVQAMIQTWNRCSGGIPVEMSSLAAADREETIAAVDQMRGEVAVIVGSGSSAVHDVLVEASRDGDFILWEVTEPLDQPHAYAFSARPNSTQIAHAAANYVERDVVQLLDGEVLRTAVFYEDQPRARAIAEAVADVLAPAIFQKYDPRTSYETAIQIRETQVNAMVYVTLEKTTGNLRNDLLQADANLKAWVQINSAPVEPDNCKVVTVSASGEVNEAYRTALLGELYAQYERIYVDLYGKSPSPRADLAASGMYLLLQLLSSIPETGDATGDATVDKIQNHIITAELDAEGLWNEQWRYDPDTQTNATSVVVIQQLQPSGMCTLYPDALATCENPLMAFPTWREQARLSFRCR